MISNPKNAICAFHRRLATAGLAIAALAVVVGVVAWLMLLIDPATAEEVLHWAGLAVVAVGGVGYVITAGITEPLLAQQLTSPVIRRVVLPIWIEPMSVLRGVLSPPPRAPRGAQPDFFRRPFGSARPTKISNSPFGGLIF